MDSLRLNASPAIAAADFPPFLMRAPWWGGDLQTLRNFLMRRRPALAAPERLLLPMRDGSGDRLLAAVHRPVPAAVKPRPLAVLLHGLSGCEDSAYVLNTASHLLALGFPVLRLNLRGAGPSRPFCRFQYHAGRSEDLADALAALPADLVTAGVVAIGYSLGANMLLKFLGERGGEAPVKAAVAVSAPLDLAVAARQMMRRRNVLYQGYLLRHMRAESLAPGAEVTAAERAAIREARSIWEFDHGFSAPRNGFGGAEDYYERNAARRYLDGIAVPTLVIHALDDPWIPGAPYLAYDWRRNPSLVALLPPRGGHVGFQGRHDRRIPWHDLCAAQFLAAF
jgi:predicted alpha/beta-fold hydrolase